MRKMSVLDVVYYILYFGAAVWANLSAFYVLAISGASLASKFLVFILIALFNMYSRGILQTDVIESRWLKLWTKF